MFEAYPNQLLNHLNNDQPVYVSSTNLSSGHGVVAYKFSGSTVGLMNPGTARYESAYYVDSKVMAFSYNNSTYIARYVAFPGKWHKWGSGWWYMYANGKYATGWLQDGSTWYFLNTSTGRMYSSQWVSDGHWYWLKASGAMAKSESIYINGKTYHFNSSGQCTNP
jgi:glucan-binding YG repeat protein